MRLILETWRWVQIHVVPGSLRRCTKYHVDGTGVVTTSDLLGTTVAAVATMSYDAWHWRHRVGAPWCVCVYRHQVLLKFVVVKWYMLCIVICSTAIYYKVGRDNTKVAGAMMSNESGPRMPQCWHLTVYLHECVYLQDQTQHRRIVTRGALQIFSVLFGIHYWE